MEYNQQDVRELLRYRLLVRAGLGEAPAPKYTLEDLERSEWNPQFERYMRNRLIMGALRYGRLGDPNKPQYDRVSSIRGRILRYAEDGNLEHLVDVANECLLEFTESRHPKQHFAAQDGDRAFHTTRVRPQKPAQRQKLRTPS